MIYKENRDDWRRAEIVVTTVQSLLFNNKYQRLFSPTDFDLVISDEAHRSIGGNARAVFDYFIGYKLGLTATPRDYLRRFDKANPSTRDPREAERRLLLDTYRTFGCENSQPTFRYSLLDGVKEGYLINPTVVDARTEITTELLSEEGFVVSFTDDAGEDQQEAFKQREFEKRFFADATNQLFCKTFLENALRDPVSGEIGKSIIFAVSQNHAAKLAQILNQMADRMFPGKYQSDFAVQVTSQIPDAQQFTINFSNNNLLGSANFLPAYKTSKARVCVTVGMMTTGYDCTDILNLGLFRPIFSPTDFIQIKGRGTRKHNFLEQLFDDSLKDGVKEPQKTAFKLFDFFANCEYFEEEFNYDEVLKLPRPKGKGREGRRRHRPRGGGRHLRAPRRGHPLDDQGRDHRLRGHEDRPDVLREIRGHRARERDHRRRRRGRAVGPRHRLREPRGLRQARGVLHPRQAAQSRRRGPPPDAARDPGEDLRPHPALQVQGRTAGRGVRQVRRRLQAGRGRGHPGHQDLLQGLRHQRPGAPHHREQGSSPIWRPIRCSPPATSRPCRRSTARSFPNTSRTTSP